VSAAAHDVRVKGAAQAVATLTDWEAKAASAKQQLINLERQAAEALAELEEHQAHTARVKQRQIRQRQSLQPAWKRQQELLAAIEAAGNGDRGYVWPVAGAAGAALAAQAVEMNQMTCVLGSCVPDPAAAAVAGVVAVENAVQHAGQVLHNLHL
jgi:septal ring factor EnvC (AmiA/AmiB activator)